MDRNGNSEFNFTNMRRISENDIIDSIGERMTERTILCTDSLKNNPLIDWCSILWLFVNKYIAITKAKAEEDDNYKCLIVDDSFLQKSGKYIEKASKMWKRLEN